MSSLNIDALEINNIKDKNVLIFFSLKNTAIITQFKPSYRITMNKATIA